MINLAYVHLRLPSFRLTSQPSKLSKLNKISLDGSHAFTLKYNSIIPYAFYPSFRNLDFLPLHHYSTLVLLLIHPT